ncbi:4F2 cell-surface antigen heavy chain [Halotydeus destructor]|nr:4F2 cell-surface antigen heavy chain [Halotydeus destructor]
MSDHDDQTAIDLDPEKGATQPLTGGESPVKAVFTSASPGKGEPNVEISTRPLSQGLTKDELMKYANDPTWVRIRTSIFVLYWIVWIGMCVASAVIIATSKKCSS